MTSLPTFTVTLLTERSHFNPSFSNLTQFKRGHQEGVLGDYCSEFITHVRADVTD